VHYTQMDGSNSRLPDRGHCVVFSAKGLRSHSASLHPVSRKYALIFVRGHNLFESVPRSIARGSAARGKV